MTAFFRWFKRQVKKSLHPLTACSASRSRLHCLLRLVLRTTAERLAAPGSFLIDNFSDVKAMIDTRGR